MTLHVVEGVAVMTGTRGAVLDRGAQEVGKVGTDRGLMEAGAGTIVTKHGKDTAPPQDPAALQALATAVTMTVIPVPPAGAGETTTVGAVDGLGDSLTQSPKMTAMCWPGGTCATRSFGVLRVPTGWRHPKSLRYTSTGNGSWT